MSDQVGPPAGRYIEDYTMLFGISVDVQKVVDPELDAAKDSS
jgi:hypothetical protein